MSKPNLTIGQSIDEFLQVKASKSVAYERDIRMTLRGFARIVGDVQARHLTDRHVTSAFDKWARTNGPATLNKKRATVSEWLAFASRRGHVRRHPADLMLGVERRRVTHRRNVYLTAGQLAWLIQSAAHPRDRAYLALAMNTALRAGEITSLKIGDLDLAANLLYIVRHKTGTVDALPITSDLEGELRTWLTWYAEQVGALEPEMFLVPAKQAPRLNGPRQTLSAEDLAAAGLKPYKQIEGSNAIMRTLLDRAGIPTEREGMHTIRRSIARLAYDYFSAQDETRDEALSVVQATLGHATQAMTERYIGRERYREKRDLLMRGKPFLSAMVGNLDNVRSISDGSNLPQMRTPLSRAEFGTAAEG